MTQISHYAGQRVPALSQPCLGPSTPALLSVLAPPKPSRSAGTACAVAMPLRDW